MGGAKQPCENPHVSPGTCRCNPSSQTSPARKSPESRKNSVCSYEKKSPVTRKWFGLARGFKRMLGFLVALYGWCMGESGISIRKKTAEWEAVCMECLCMAWRAAFCKWSDEKNRFVMDHEVATFSLFCSQKEIIVIMMEINGEISFDSWGNIPWLLSF